MFNFFSLFSEAWSVNPLDYGPLAGVIVIVIIFISKLKVLVDYAKFKDNQVLEITSSTTKVLSDVTDGLRQLAKAIEDQRKSLEFILVTTVEKTLKAQLKEYFKEEEGVHNFLKDKLIKLEKIIELQDPD